MKDDHKKPTVTPSERRKLKSISESTGRSLMKGIRALGEGYVTPPTPKPILTPKKPPKD